MCVDMHELYLCMFQDLMTACCVFISFCVHVLTLCMTLTLLGGLLLTLTLDFIVPEGKFFFAALHINNKNTSYHLSILPWPPVNLATLLALLPCSEWASWSVMFGVSLRKETIPKLDLIEHVTWSCLLKLWLCVCVFVCVSNHLWLSVFHVIACLTRFSSACLCMCVNVNLSLGRYLWFSVSCNCEHAVVF